MPVIQKRNDRSNLRTVTEDERKKHTIKDDRKDAKRGDTNPEDFKRGKKQN